MLALNLNERQNRAIGFSLKHSDQVRRGDLAGLSKGLASFRIALLEASRPNRDFVESTLRSESCAISNFSSIEEVMKAFSAGEIFDVLIASIDGMQDVVIETIEYLQNSFLGQTTPVLLLLHPHQLSSAASFDPGNMIDFVLLPCEERELVARVARVGAIGLSTIDMENGFNFGPYSFDPFTRVVSYGDGAARLQPIEFDLALYLFRHAGSARSRSQISHAVWKKESPKEPSRALDTHVVRIRKTLKLHAMDSSAAVLATVSGFGYRLFFKQEGSTQSRYEL